MTARHIAVALAGALLYTRDVMIPFVLAIFITAVYILVVGGIGVLVGARGNTTLSFVAAAILAVAFQPARERARRLADRVVYGKRATPYEVLEEFSDRMSEAYATEDVLPRMARILGEAVGGERRQFEKRRAGIDHRHHAIALLLLHTAVQRLRAVAVRLQRGGDRRRGEEVAGGLVRATTDAAAELVELQQAEAVGVLDHHHRRVGDVDPDLDDRRGHQHLRAARGELGPRRFLLIVRHPPVQ